MLNKAQAEKLFAKNAILLGTQDAIPYAATLKILGADAADYAMRAGQPGKDSNVYSCGLGQIPYFYKSGFLMAASYANALEYCAKDKERSTL